MHLSGVDAGCVSEAAVSISTSFCMLDQCIGNTCIMPMQVHASMLQLQHLLWHAGTAITNTAQI